MKYKEIEDLIEGKTVELWAEYRHVDNGIGWYECHGYRGFDSQPDIEVTNITWEHAQFTAEENTIIDNYVDEHYEELDNYFYENFEGDDSGEPDPDDYRDEMLEREHDREFDR